MDRSKENERGRKGLDTVDTIKGNEGRRRGLDMGEQD